MVTRARRGSAPSQCNRLFFAARFLYDEHAGGAGHEEHARYGHHAALGAAYEAEHHAAEGGCYYLRYAYRAVEQSEVCAHMAAVECVGDDGERHGQHCGPCATDEQVGDEEHVLVVDVRYGQESGCAEYEAERVSRLAVLKPREHHGPAHAAYGLYGEEYAYPVACGLESGRRWVGGLPAGLGDGSVGVVPHVEEGRPTEELHESDRPKGRRSVAQQLEPVNLVLVKRFGQTVVFGVFFRRHLLHLYGCVDYA